MFACILHCSLCQYAGLFVLLSTLLTLLKNLYPLVLARLRPRNLLATYGPGSYALVTGASDGLGKAFC